MRTCVKTKVETHYRGIRCKIASPPAITWVFVLFALSFFSRVPQVLAQTEAGSISALNGSATITRGGSTIPAALGTKVDVGDRLTTAAGSSLTITFSDGSQIDLSDSSTLTLDQNTLDANGVRVNTKVSLLNGLVRSVVRLTPGTPPNYEVHTPNAVASARGTDYDVDYQTGVHESKFPGCSEFSHVSVRDGTVEVYNPTNPSAPKVEVEKRHRATIPCSGAIVLGALGLLGAVSTGQAAGAAAVGAAGAAAGGAAAAGAFSSSSTSSAPVSPSTIEDTRPHAR